MVAMSINTLSIGSVVPGNENDLLNLLETR